LRDLLSEKDYMCPFTVVVPPLLGMYDRAP
jgi:hypothetical protein